MKKFMVFFGQWYYPNGGMDDFIGDFDTIKESIKAIKEKEKEYEEDDGSVDMTFAQIYDISKKKVVKRIRCSG